MTRRVALALALTMFAMFAFRRWYAFAAAGIAVVLAIEIASIALGKGADFRWKDAVAAAALGLLTLLALMSPVIVDWLPNLSAHDYASAYAAYRKPLAVFLRELGDWVGLLPALAALAGAAFLWGRSRDRRLLRLTLGGTGVAAALFLRIQTPYIHHLDLIAPAIVTPIAASLMLVFARAPHAALLGLAGLAAVTLSPLAAALNPVGLAPIAGLPRAPRADLDELERLKNWVDQRARPDAKVCGLGSSYTFSGQLIDELWQLHPERGTDGLRRETSVTMPDVDEVDGPPAAGLKDCAIIIVGDPGPDPSRSRPSADGHRAVARNADGAGDRREISPYWRGLPSGEGRERRRVRAHRAARRRRHRRASGSLARRPRGPRLRRSRTAVMNGWAAFVDAVADRHRDTA